MAVAQAPRKTTTEGQSTDTEGQSTDEDLMRLPRDGRKWELAGLEICSGRREKPPRMDSSSMETLTGPRVQLRLLLASDGPALREAAADGELWNLPFTVIPSAETVEDYIRVALEGRASGTVVPFVIKVLEADRIIGSTRFWKIDRQNRKLEIGHTWLSASWQRTFVNTEAKFLMLRYAFEELRCVRVQFTTDEINEKSRRAILRLGAKEEGIIRHERIMPDGRKRNSVRFSIIDEEWPSVRQALEERLNEP